MIALLTALALAQDPPPAAAEEGGDEAISEEEVPTGPMRAEPPPVAAPEVLPLAAPEVHTLGRATVHVVHVPGVRKVEVAVRAGSGVLALMGEASLVGRGVGWLADAASATTDASQLSALEDVHNLDVYSRIGLHEGTLGMEVPKEDLDVGLGLLTEVVRAAAFPKAETKRWVVNQHRYYEVTGPSSLSRVASAATGFGWFPASHPYGARPDPSELDGVKNKALAELYRRWLQEAPIEVLVVGDVAYSEVEPALTAMLEGLGSDGEPEPELEVDVAGGVRVVAVDMPGQPQVGLRLRMEAPAEGDGDEVAMWAGNYAFGGHFLSRLNTNLREDKGWTYGARSSYHRGEHYGMVTVSVDVAVDNAGDAIREIEAEVARLRSEGVTDSELELAYRRLVQSWNTTRGTASDALDRYDRALDRGESIEQARARYVALADVTPDDVQRAATTWLGDERARLWVVVGDRAALEPQLEALGWSPQWISPEQAILGTF